MLTGNPLVNQARLFRCDGCLTVFAFRPDEEQEVPAGPWFACPVCHHSRTLETITLPDRKEPSSG